MKRKYQDKNIIIETNLNIEITDYLSKFIGEELILLLKDEVILNKQEKTTNTLDREKDDN